MTTIYYPSMPFSPEGGYAATIGFFDGVHLGHRHLLRLLLQEAGARGLHTMAVTFDRPPREVVQPGWHPQLLTTLGEKAALLSATGIDVLVVLRFDEAMAALTARQFMGGVLHGQLGVSLLLTGYDNHFGHDRAASFADYVAYGRELGVEVVCAGAPARCAVAAADGLSSQPGEGLPAAACSSSLVRRLLTAGDVEAAAACLLRPYAITGHVVHGEHKGHGLGFPTANLVADEPLKLVPAKGVYAVEAVTADGRRHHAMTNIGTRPTFGGAVQTLETNIFGFAGNIYGQPLTIGFVARLRPERPFPSAAALAEQLARDRLAAQQCLARREAGDHNI